ncbi:MAG: FecR domain-containing protein [Polyangiaceae bacterium]|nr:FecR domain-containing protein [Polyangiaceae bacterium]
MTNTDRLLSQIAREEDALLAASDRRALVRRRLQAAKSPPRTVRWSPRTALALAGSCALVGTATVFFWVARPPPPLTATAGPSSAQVASGSWLDAPETVSLPLRFSDGTKVDVAPHGRMRLLELGPRGAKLALESGRAGFDVAHGENRRWELRAGRFIVRVTGTRFDVGWSPEEDQFELVLYEGQVELSGCGFEEGRRLVTGQTVRASCRDGAVRIAYDAIPLATGGPFAPTAAAPATTAVEDMRQLRAPMPGSVAKTASVASQTTGVAPAEADWKLLAQQGKYADALAAADRLGFGALCARADADTLALLGDVARHARGPNKARRAYSSLRQRFAGSRQAGPAAFSLGVLEFDQWRAYGRAAAWFRTYVRENPRGPLVREARGRLMEALHRLGSNEARSLATSYLRDYPSGPYAELAQRIVQQR